VSSAGARRPSISGIVICFNEERRIERCLQSLAFCDEIIVVDSRSTDRTREIAARYATKLVEQDFLGYVKQKNFALERATGEWVVCLDADEALSSELQRDVPLAIASAPADVAGFVLDRVPWFLGVWHDAGEWYPDRQMRVFRRVKGHWIGRDPHDRVELDGVARPLSGKLEHWNYRDLSDHISTIDRFSARQAQGMAEEGLRFRISDLVFRPLIRFVRGYVLRRGFTKGLPGFLVSVSTAYYVFMKYAKLWEIERATRADRR
jgi:glycosyltransferase involved in cell wall biosynthesis